MKKLLLFFVFLSSALWASDTIPADISFLVADLKYNKEQGVKICEIQSGSVSAFEGYDYLYEGEGLVGENFCAFLSHYHNSFWFLSKSVTHPPIRTRMLEYGWQSAESMRDLLSDDSFQAVATKKPENPHSIKDYSAIVYAKKTSVQDMKKFKETYPGALLIDQANWSVWADKNKMSELFSKNKVLKNLKPRWKQYPKKYTSHLAKQIKREMPSDLYVIKPLHAALGYGVIIVESKNLDSTLKYIFKKPPTQRENPDRSYYYWFSNRDSSFIVEEFIQSDPVYVPSFNNLPFNGTLRVAFALTYDEGEIDLQFLGEYWIIPEKALTENGSLNSRHKASMIIPPHICIAEDEVRDEVKSQLTEPLKELYRTMLGFSSHESYLQI